MNVSYQANVKMQVELLLEMLTQPYVFFFLRRKKFLKLNICKYEYFEKAFNCFNKIELKLRIFNTNNNLCQQLRHKNKYDKQYPECMFDEKPFVKQNSSI